MCNCVTKPSFSQPNQKRMKIGLCGYGDSLDWSVVDLQGNAMKELFAILLLK